MFDPSAFSSRLRDQRSRKKCPNKQISAQGLWPSIKIQGICLPNIKLHGIKLLSIKLHGIKFQGIRLHGARLLSISDLSRNLFLPIRMINPRLTNQGTI
jgi:hypothetical protein